MKILQKIALGLILTLLLILSGTFLWLKYGWKYYFRQEQLISYISEIKATPPLPEYFKEVYFKVYPEQQNGTLTEEIMRIIFFPLTARHNTCLCDDIYDLDWSTASSLTKENKYNRLLNIYFGYALEKHLTHEECFKYFITVQYHQLKNIHQGFSFEGKVPEDFNEQDMVDFIIAMHSPYHYSSRRNPTFYQKMKNRIEEQSSR